MFQLFLTKFKVLLKNPMSLFVYGIMSKWYVLIMVTAMIVTFWVFKGLTDAGVLQAAEKIVSKALSETKSVARYCVPKITNLSAFWNCLENPPAYKPTKDEELLEKSMNNLTDFSNYDQSKDPYAE